MSARDLNTLLNPKSIAVVGVSDMPSKIGSVIFNNILSAGFRGNVYPVNNKRDMVLGKKAYKKVSDIDEVIDQVVISVPAEFVPDVMKDIAETDTKTVIIITGGFRETGKEGRELEQSIMEIARENDIQILGPNCLGVNVPRNNLNATFAPSSAKPGKIAFVSQSGAINTAVLDISEEMNLGFCHFISLGNKIDLNENDFLESWLDDDSVEVIGMYIEEFSDGNDFLELLKSKTRKPVVILHPGASEKVKSVMQSHTGSLTSSSEIISTGLKQFGAIQVGSIEELIGTLQFFDRGKKINDLNTVIVTNAGGPGIVGTDLLSSLGVKMWDVPAEVKTKLSEFLPTSASLNNPIDIVGDALSDRYKNTFEVLETRDDIDVVIPIITPQYVTQIEDIATTIIKANEKSDKIFVPVLIGGKRVNIAFSELHRAGIPTFRYLEEAVRSINNFFQYLKFEIPKEETSSTRQGLYEDEINEVLKEEDKVLDFELTENICHEFGIKLPKQKLIKSKEDLGDVLSKFKKPVVLKVPSDVQLHKTEKGGIKTGLIETSDILNNYGIMSKESDSERMIIQEQIIGGMEVFVGAVRDGDSNVYEEDGVGFGHLLVFGSGGIYTEIRSDISRVLVPADKDVIRKHFMETEISEMISGARGKKALAVGKLIELLLNVQRMLLTYPQINSLDMNPVIVTEEDAYAVDLKILVRS